MYYLKIVLYGSVDAQKTARNILQNLDIVRREEINSGEIGLILSEPLKETSLISLLRSSGIYGFRLAKYNS